MTNISIFNGDREAQNNGVSIDFVETGIADVISEMATMLMAYGYCEECIRECFKSYVEIMEKEEE